MTSGVPWQVEGIRQQAREAALEAARRSGMSVGEWLDSVIAGTARGEGSARHAQTDDDDNADIDDRHSRRAPAEDIAEVKGRLDEVGRQLDQLSRLNATQAYLRPNLHAEEPPRELVDVISRLGRRLDQLIASGRLPDNDVERRGGAADRAALMLNREPPGPAPATDPSTPLEQALMEIARRQRALDADGGPSAASSARADLLPRAPTQGLSSLEDQLRQVTTRFETLRPCGVNEAFETLRDDLAEIGLMLKQAMPRQAIEALEVEVRSLSERLHINRQAESTDAAIAGVERGLADIRDALRALTPAENLVGVEEMVRELSRKIDLISFNTQDPAAMEQLEGAIVGLRGIATQVASDGALEKLSDEVRGLAAKVDQIASSNDLLSTLEHRISSVAEALEARGQAGAAIPSDLDAVVKGLADRLERRGFTRAEPAATGQLEDRITTLVEKLDTSNDRLNHLETIEHALADLLAFLERQPDVEHPAAAPSPEVTSLRQDVQETQNSLQTVQGSLEQLIDRLAAIENDVRSVSPAPANQTPEPVSPALGDRPTVAAAPVTSASPVVPARTAQADPVPPPAPHEHRPIDPNLPPDHPLEPGAMRGRTGNSPGDRIAASEAALGPAKPPVVPDPAGKSNFIAAARRAAQAANSERVTRNDKSGPTTAAKSTSEGKTAGGWGDRVRSLLVAVSVVLIVLSSLHLVANLFGSSEQLGDGSRPQETQSSPKSDEPNVAPESAGAIDERTVPSPKTPATPTGRQSLIMPTDGTTAAAIPAAASPGEAVRQPAAAAPVPGAAPVAPETEVTGSISRPAAPIFAMPTMPALPATASPPRAAHTAAIDRLPAAISGALRTAAAKGDPAAEYEIAQRYAEGRGVQQNLAEAADWFDLAAKQGLAPAQFRLGGFYEKGFGVKKDLDAARRLYSAAADAGNAKAMHNLAVLYAEGIDGKPDYQNAAKWFRKASDYGLTDSQYNLGILYGRGIGMEPNLAEAYKWFSLAARDGDRESASKRDDVGGRMDQLSLATAKLAAKAWVPLEQPEAATQAAVPAGGWDNAAAPPPANPRPRNLGAKADRSTPPLVR
jgi:localization factor PodJL